MGVKPPPSQVGQARPVRVRRRGPAKRFRPDFATLARPSREEIIGVMVREGVFDKVLARLKLKYRIGD